MRVLLLKDVYNLGKAGEVRKVAAGYGRNFLIPQGLAVMATKGALKQAEYIRKRAAKERERLNLELSEVAEEIEGIELAFPVKAGETGKLYGSVTPAMIAEAVNDQVGSEIDKRDVDSQPIKMLGVHTARVRLTIDLVPEVTVIVHREGEPPESVIEEEPVEAPEKVGEFAELQAELEAEEAAYQPEPPEAEVAPSEAVPDLAEGDETPEAMAETEPDSEDSLSEPEEELEEES
jgi:large subunit ribosomal protein L9